VAFAPPSHPPPPLDSATDSNRNIVNIPIYTYKSPTTTTTTNASNTHLPPHLTSQHPSTWSTADVKLWLQASPDTSGPHLLTIFETNQVDGNVLMALTAKELRDDLGVVVFGERVKLEKRLKELKSQWGLVKEVQSESQDGENNGEKTGGHAETLPSYSDA
jgi:hypothetical protein